MEEHINWGRGLLRIWLVSAFIWCGYYGWKTHFFGPAYDTAHAWYVAYTLGPLAPWEIDPETSITKHPVKIKTIKTGSEKVKRVDLPDGTYVEFPSDKSDKEIRVIVQDGLKAMRIKADEKARAHNDFARLSSDFAPAARDFALIGIGPPLGLLLLGILVRWIINGFRPKEWD